MGFLIFLIIVALIIIAVSAFSKISNLDGQIKLMRQQLSILQENIWKLKRSIDSSQSPPIPDSTVELPATDVYNTHSTEGTHPPAKQPTVVSASIQSPPRTVQPAPAVQSQTSRQPFPAPVGSSRQSFAGDTGNAAPSFRSIESWVGKNIIGIAASVLVFIGLIFLGVLVYEHITDTIKILAMFAISTVLTVTGTLLLRKRSNNFTMSLTGCGTGSFFISILLTHIYFNAINELMAFGLLLVWMAATLMMSKRFDSLLLSIIAHAGMIFSICFIYTMALSTEKLLIITIYEFASIAIIVGGNIVCFKKTYRFGVAASMLLALFSGFMVWNGYQTGNLSVNHSLPALLMQFACISFLSYLFAVSVNRIDPQKEYRTALHLVNKFIWVTALFSQVYFALMEFYLKQFTGFTAGSIAFAVSMIFVILHSVITIIMRSKLNFSENFEQCSVVIMSLSTIVFFILYQAVRTDAGLGSWTSIPFFILPMLLLIIGYRFGKAPVYKIMANIFAGLDFLFMMLFGYKALSVSSGTILLPLAYVLIYLVFIWYQYIGLSKESRPTYFEYFKIISVLIIELSSTVILLTSGIKYNGFYLIFSMLLFTALLSALRFDGRKQGAFDKFLLFEETLWTFISAAYIAFTFQSASNMTPCLILMPVTVIVSLIRLKDIISRTASNAARSVSSVNITLIAVSVVYSVMARLGSVEGFAKTLHENFLIIPCALVFIGYYFLQNLLLNKGNEYNQTLNIQKIGLMSIMELVFIVSFLVSGFEYSDGLIFGTMLTSFIVFNIFKLGATITDTIFVQINSILLPFIYSICLKLLSETEERYVLYLLISALAFCLSLISLPAIVKRTSDMVTQLSTVINFTLLTLVVIDQYTVLTSAAYMFSLICMVIAFICIVSGFLWKAKFIRFYGLLLTLVCVLKLVTYDVSGLETIYRVISLIGGGIICFAISALYNYSVKKINVD